MTVSSPCWDCVKGRHSICTGIDEFDDTVCACPVPHDGNPRKPVLAEGGYVDDPETAPVADWANEV